MPWFIFLECRIPSNAVTLIPWTFSRVVSGPFITDREKEGIAVCRDWFPSRMIDALTYAKHLFQQFIVQTRFVCQFNIEGRVTIVNARLLADTIYCEETEFSYTSRAPNITVPFAVIWGGSKPLDNPHNIHLVIYRCRDMADNCGMCLTLAPKYDCGWCQSTDRCEVKDNCERNTGMWLNSNQTCPNPEIHSFEPVMGPWEGNTNVTIRGINLGQTFMVRGNILIHIGDFCIISSYMTFSRVNKNQIFYL